jgi:hypothetical protein
MMIATLVLLLLPCSLLWTAWKRSKAITSDGDSLNWRILCGKAALIMAGLSTLLELLFFFSWFHNGGSPHGLMPSPGIWEFVGRIAALVLVVAVVLSTFGKGRWRLLILGWAGSIVLVTFLLFRLEMD